MKMVLLGIICFFLCLSSLAVDEMTFLSRIEHHGSNYVLIRLDSGQSIPFIPGDENVKSALGQLPHRTEAIVKGHLTYQALSEGDGRIVKPFFVITQLRRVSLQEMGRISREIPVPSPSPVPTETYPRSPTFPVSTEVASAITFTSTLLLMNSLTTGDNPTTQDQLRTGLFISAGAMATVLYLYEQLSGKTKP
jgi:hypothetical protein